MPEEDYSPKIGVAVALTPVPSQVVLPTGIIDQTFYFLAAIRTSLESANATTASLKDLAQGMAQEEQLLDSHIGGWALIWGSGIEVTGDLDLAVAINSSLYYILSSIRIDTPWSLSPGSLATNGYNGHTFWE